MLLPGHQVDSSNNDGGYSKSNLQDKTRYQLQIFLTSAHPNPSHALQYDRKLGQQGELRHEVGGDGRLVLEPHHREEDSRHIGQDCDAADWRQEYVHLEPIAKLMRRTCEKAILPGGDISWNAGKRLHFEAGAMLNRVWTESRLDKGEVIGVGVQEVGLRDEHRGSIPGNVTLEYRSKAGEVKANLQRLVL